MTALLRLAVLLTAGAGLCSCAARVDGPLSPTFGLAAASLDLQASPGPVSPEPPDSSAARGVLAVQRYEKGAPRSLEAGPTTITAVPAAGPAGDGPG